MLIPSIYLIAESETKFTGMSGDTGGTNYCYYNNQSSGTSMTGSYVTGIAAGDAAILIITTDNVTTTQTVGTTLHSSVTDTKTNTWTKVAEVTNGQGAAGSGVTMSLWYSNISSAVTTSDTITATFSSAITAKAMNINRFSVHTGNKIVVAAYTTGFSTTTALGSLTLSGLPNQEYLFFRAIGGETSNHTLSSVSTGFSTNNYSATNNATDNLNVISISEHMIKTTKSATSSPTASVAANAAHIFVAFREIISTATRTTPSTRNPQVQPFSSTSIWNMPIGTGAVYVASNLNGNPTDPANTTNTTYAPMPDHDEEHIIMSPTSPVTNFYSNGWSGDRCTATGTTALISAPVPSSYTVASSNANSCCAILAADGRTIKQANAFTRCTASASGTVYATFADVDIYSDGMSGGHGGSSLSSIGGSIRIGELRPGQTGPTHALKINIYARQFLYKAATRAPTNWSGGGTGGSYRWPATTSDSYWNNSTSGYGMNSNAVNNSNPDMCMGALLAIPASTSIASLGLVTEPAKQLAWTLQNYGAYIVDDTWGPAVSFSIENGPNGSKAAEFQADYGFAFMQRVIDNTTWVQDMQKLVSALHVVSNNSATTVGGGGTPLQPLAPAIAP